MKNVDADSFEYKVTKLKSLKSEMTALSSQYERLNETLSEVIARQKELSKEYGKLKTEVIGELEKEDEQE